jgi:hypothetical protein
VFDQLLNLRDAGGEDAQANGHVCNDSFTARRNREMGFGYANHGPMAWFSECAKQWFSSSFDDSGRDKQGRQRRGVDGVACGIL